jgi:hypothetical protein
MDDRPAVQALVANLESALPNLEKLLGECSDHWGYEDPIYQDNRHWPEATRPIVEAFFHARYFLEMAVRYGRQLSVAPQLLPSGWAALLYLYRLR